MTTVRCFRCGARLIGTPDFHLCLSLLLQPVPPAGEWDGQKVAV